MFILLAPLYSLFSLDFYRRIIQFRLRRGFVYLLYLSTLATIFSAFLFTSRGLPEINRIVEWAKTTMPALTWTPEGLVMNVPSPYTMIHPDLGSLVTFDMNQTEVVRGTMGESLMFVTSKKIFIKQGINEVRVYDLMKTLSKNGRAVPQTAVVQITSDSLQTFYNSLKPWLVFLAVLFTFVFFFVWKLLAAIFYSWVGLLINFSRHPKLNYSAILNLSLFALTPATLIQAAQLAVPALGRLPFGILGSILVTGIYLFLAIKKTQRDSLEPHSPDLESAASES